jgi:hypothetical protein
VADLRPVHSLLRNQCREREGNFLQSARWSIALVQDGRRGATAEPSTRLLAGIASGPAQDDKGKLVWLSCFGRKGKCASRAVGRRTATDA